MLILDFKTLSCTHNVSLFNSVGPDLFCGLLFEVIVISFYRSRQFALSFEFFHNIDKHTNLNAIGSAKPTIPNVIIEKKEPTGYTK